MEIWTLTVDDTDSIYTSVHPTDSAAIAALFNQYDSKQEFSRDDIQPLLDANGLVIHIDSHTVDWARTP